MSSVRDYVTPYLPPFVKPSNGPSGSGSSWFLANCTPWHLLYLTSLLAAFAAGGVLGHLYWRRVRAWSRRAHARAHRWTSARRQEVVALWVGVVARVEGAVAGWKNGMGGSGGAAHNHNNNNVQRNGGGAGGTAGHPRIVVLETATATATEEEARAQGGGRKNHRRPAFIGRNRY